MHLMKLGKLLVKIWWEWFLVFGSDLPLPNTTSPPRVDTDIHHIEMHPITLSDRYLRRVNGITNRFYELCSG